MVRSDGRAPDEPRKARIAVGVQEFAEGSALIEVGRTRVLCTATIEERVPSFLRAGGQGWITAEYGMLPRSTLTRTPRDEGGRPGGRTAEIQRLIGRSLRAVADLKALGERTVTLDCDVLQADGGTRTASITGAYVALYQALHGLVRHRVLPQVPLRCRVAAVSVGIVQGGELLDLCYQEDSQAEVDFNLVMTDQGEFVELQATAEGRPFSRGKAESLQALGWRGIEYLLGVQAEAIATL